MTASDDTDGLGASGPDSFIIGELKGRLAANTQLYAGLAALFLLIVIAGVIWASYPRPGVQGPVPVIRADTTPWRVKPDDPGGMDIPYRDSTVFNAMHGDEPDKVENLMPKTEQPLPREKLIPGLKTEAAPAATPANTPAAAPAVTMTPPIAHDSKPATAAPAIVKPAPVPAVPPTVGWYVQLGSVTAEKDAPAAWKKFGKTHPLVADVALHVEKADLGAKGIYYRLQGGPLEEKRAREICAAVTAKKPGGCLVVKH